jgi:type III secretory pathway component EscT
VIALPPELEARCAVALLAALRLLPVALASPFLGGPFVPAVARIGLAAGLGIAATAQVAPGAPAPSGVGLALLAARELLLGTVLAFLAAAPVEAARAAGRLADTLRGATLCELHVAPIRQRESATGDLLAHWVVVLAAWAGGDRLLLRGLLGTFASIPPGGPFASGAALAPVLHVAGEVIAAALAMSAPVAAGVLAADLAVSLVARVAPQLGAVNVAQPARAAVGLFAVAAAASAVAGRLVSLVALSADATATLRVGP